MLTATVSFLAIHQDEQGKAYQEVLSITPGREPVRRHQGCLTLADLFGQVIDDVAKLPHLLACFLEAMRIYRKHILFPYVHRTILIRSIAAGGFLSRDVSQDTIIQTSRPTQGTVILSKGSRLIIDMIAVR